MKTSVIERVRYLDKVILNANIYTMDLNNPRAEAIYIKNDKFEKVDTVEEISSYINDKTIVIDLKGKAIYPGFIDSHMHLAMFGANLQECNLVGVKSVEEMIGRMKEHIDVNNIKPGTWITGKGWNEDYFSIKELPTRYDLDKISTEHSICLTRGCYHMCVINSHALDNIGINKENNKIENGVFDLDDMGIPTGICRESAMRYVYSQLPSITKEDIKRHIKIASKYLISKGITSVQTDDFMVPGASYKDVINAYEEIKQEGKLDIRVYEQCLLSTIKELENFIDQGYKTGMGDNNFKIGPLKILADGNFGTRTAYLTEPYSDDPTKFGISQYTQEKLDELISFAVKSGMQIAVHAIGDKSIHMIIESLKRLPPELINQDLRSTVIHCQVTDQYIIESFKSMNIIANLQPIFINYDLHMAESRLGPERILKSYNWKTLLKSGVKIALGSDCPIELPDTVFGIYSAVTRKDLNGFPEEGWYLDEGISVNEAIEGFTTKAAYASFEEDIKGSIEEGKLADFVVLSKDLFDIEPDMIKDVEVLQTYIGGELVYKK